MQKFFKNKYYNNYLKNDLYYKFKFKDESWSSFSRLAERYLAPLTLMLLLLFKIIKEKLKSKIMKDSLKIIKKKNFNNFLFKLFILNKDRFIYNDEI
jgi:hypothetical protein